MPKSIFNPSLRGRHYSPAFKALVERWSENVLWQYFSGREYYEHRPPCDPSQLSR